MTTPTASTPDSRPQADSPPARRRIPGGPLAAIIVGAVLAVAMVFGGGVALGVALPVGGHHGPAFDRDGGPRAGLPGHLDPRTNPGAPSAPNQDDTETRDESEQG